MHDERHCERERHELVEVIERLFHVIDRLLSLGTVPANLAVILKGKLNMAQNATKFTVTELDSAENIVPINRPINVSSDNPAVATVDQSQQTANPDGSVSFPVTSVAGATGVANIVATDPAALGPDGLPLAGGDVDNVGPVQGAVAKVVGVLS